MDGQPVETKRPKRFIAGLHAPAGSPEMMARVEKRRATLARNKAAALADKAAARATVEAALRRVESGAAGGGSLHCSAQAETLDAALLAPVTRHWTTERQIAFIAALSETGRVDKAVRAAGMTATHALYALRRSDPTFADAWTDALAAHAETLEAIVLDQAINGYTRDATRTYSERLMVEVLRRVRKGAGAGGAEPAAGATETVQPSPGKAGEEARLFIEATLAGIARRIEESR